MKTKIIAICSVILLATGLGCAALSHYVTPAPISKDAVNYAVKAGVADPNSYRGYPNLVKAIKLQTDTDSAHSVIQLDLQQKIQKDNLEYAIHKDVVASNVVAGQNLEETLFGETGLLTLGLSLAGFGTLTGLIGLMRKRPGDVTKDELTQAIALTEGKSAEELSAKEKQFIEVVSGVKKFMDYYKSQPSTDSPQIFAQDVVSVLKDIFDKTQDTNTQIAVSTVKKSL
jgi:hypothetical protein